MKIKNKLEHAFEILFLILFLLVFSVVMCIINHISVINGISFWIFQVGGMILPGMAAVLLLRLKNLSKLGFVAISYAVGYCLNIIFYYLTVPFGGREILRYLILAVALGSLFIIYRKWDLIEGYKRDTRGNIVCLVFIVILTVIEIFTVCVRNFYPPNMEENTMVHDMLYWVGNTITLTRGYPATNFRDYTYPYTYHYLSSMQLAVASLVTHIRPIVLSFDFSFIQPIIIMVTGLYTLFRKFTAKTWLIVVGLLSLLLVEGQIDSIKINYISHLLSTQFGFDIGMGIYSFLILFLVEQWQEKKFDGRWCLLAVIFSMITAGLKSPFGAIGVCIAGIMCFGWLLRKEYCKAFTYGIPILIGFLIMYVFVINLGNSDQPEASILKTFLMAPSIYNNSPLVESWHNSMVSDCGIFILKPIMEVIFMACGLVVINFCIFVPFFYFLMMKVVVLKKWDLLDSVCTGVVAVGTVITLKWGNPDYSIAYFVMAGYIPAVMFTIRTVQQLCESGMKFSGIRKWVLIFAGSILLCGGVYESYVPNRGYFTDFKIGVRNLFSIERNDIYQDDRAYICADDYEAYEWIRFHTEEDTLIAANKGLQLGREDTSRHSRVAGVFTERYVIANDVTDDLFYDLDYGKLEELKEFGVEYVIYNNTATEGFVLPAEQIVYANDTNVIYQLE